MIDILGFKLYLKVLHDFGPIGRPGVSNPHYVRAENGNEYIVKGPHLSPGEFYAAANELISILLANTLGLPVLDHRLLLMDGNVVFATTRMANGSFYDEISESLFLKCGNLDCVYDLVAFDYWLFNNDRHSSNLIVRKFVDPTGEAHILLLNDHSRCLAKPNILPASLTHHLKDTYRCLRLPFLAEKMTNTPSLCLALTKFGAIRDDNIRAVVESVPDEILPPEDGKHMIDFLCRRRDCLPELFKADAHLFRHIATEDL